MCVHVCQSVCESQSPNFWASVIHFEALYIPGLGERTPKGSFFGDTVAPAPPNKKSPNYLGWTRILEETSFSALLINSFSFRKLSTGELAE